MSFAKWNRLTAAVVVSVLWSFVCLPCVPPSEAEEGGVAPLAIVLDASGSMTATDVPGAASRMDAAKSATAGLIDALAPDQEFAVVTYGTGTGSSDAEQEAGCRDVTQLRPLSSGDVDKAKDDIGKLEPRGYTPIGESLRQAAAQLPEGQARPVVLVSDGEDTCAPPEVCDVAKELKSHGVGLVVNTVGLNIDPAGRRDLECIAEATGGTYADAADRGSLETSMKAAARSGSGYEMSGQKVDGAQGRWDSAGDPSSWTRHANVDQAPVVIPGLPESPTVLSGAIPAFPADFRPEVRTHGMTSAYKVRLTKGDTLHIGLVSPGIIDNSPMAEGDSTIRINYVSPNGDAELGTWDSSPRLGEPAFLDQTIHADETGDYTILALRDGEALADQPVPIELRLAAYSHVDDGASTDASQAPSVNSNDVAKALPIDSVSTRANAGTSPATAAAIAPGTVSDDIVPGETRFYSVPVEWGQSFYSHLLIDDAFS